MLKCTCAQILYSLVIPHCTSLLLFICNWFLDKNTAVDKHFIMDILFLKHAWDVRQQTATINSLQYRTLSNCNWRLSCKRCRSLHSFVPSKLLLLRSKCIKTPVDWPKLIFKQKNSLFDHVGALLFFSAAHVDRRTELVAKIPTSSDLRVHVNCQTFTH